MNHGFVLLVLPWMNDRGLSGGVGAAHKRLADGNGLRVARLWRGSGRRRWLPGSRAAEGYCRDRDCLRTTSTEADILQLCLCAPQFDAESGRCGLAQARACRGQKAASPPRAGLRAALCVIVLAAAALACPAAAGAQTRSAPQPPPRPAGIGQPSAQPPLQSQPQPPAAAKPDEPLDLDHPPMLPSASRERMSACGREWQAVKKAGKDVDIGWRAFATRCLTR